MAAVAGPKVGVFGGAFDPPHLGHVALAPAGIEQFALDRLLVRVIEDPPTRRCRRRPRPGCAWPSSRSSRLRERGGRARPVRAHGRLVRGARAHRPGVPRRRRRVRVVPHVEGAGPGARAREARRRDATGRRPRAARRRPGGSRPPRACHVLRDRAAARFLLRDQGTGRGGGAHRRLVTAAVAAEIEVFGLYRRVETAGRAGVCLKRNRANGRHRPDISRTRTPHRRSLRGEAGDGRDDPRHASGVRLHRLLRARDGQERAADACDPR